MILRHAQLEPTLQERQLARTLSVPSPAIDLAKNAPPGRLEWCFLYFGVIVLEGAFLSTPRLILGDSSALEDVTASDPINQAAFGILLVVTAFLTLRHLRSCLSAIRGNLPYFLLCAMMILTTVWSINPGLTLKRGIWTTGVCFFDLYLVTRLSVDELLKVLSRTLLVCIATSFVLALAMPTVGREVNDALDGEWRGVFAQKNQLGHVMSVGGVIQIIIMLRAGRLRIGALFMLLACAILMKESQSASSLVAMLAAAGVAVAYVVMRSGPQAILVGSLIAVAFLCIAVTLIFAQGGDVFSILGRDSTFTGRADLWPPVLRMIDMKFWTGWGYEAFWSPTNPYYEFVRNEAHWPAPNAHNGLLELALDLGALGVGVFFAVLAWAVIRAVKLMFKGDSLGIITLVVLVDLLLGNITESFVLESTIFGWNFLTMLIFYAGLDRPARVRLHQHPTGSILQRAKPRAAGAITA